MNNDVNRKLNILIVEDDPLSETIIRGLLSASDLHESNIRSVETLDGALGLLSFVNIDIVLLDLNLPDSKDLNTLDRVIENYPNIAIIVITGEYEESLGLKAVARGAQDFLIKATFNQITLCKSIFYSIERKLINKQKNEAYEELDKAHNKLQKMQSRILQNEKMASIGALAAGVAHEMNTPVGFVSSNFDTLNKYIVKIMSVIHMYEELTNELSLSDDSEINSKISTVNRKRLEVDLDFINEDIQSLLTESKEGLSRIAEIVQCLRNFSRVDQVSNKENYNINDAIEATLVVAGHEIMPETIVTKDFSEIPPVVCNSVQINQVLLNIIINSAHSIRQKTRKDGLDNILIKTCLKNNMVICEISDNGEGVAEDKLHQIFDSDLLSESDCQGIERGLSVPYDIIVNNHNGEFLLDSAVGQGTKVTIKLPINDNHNIKKDIESNGKKNSFVCR